MYHIGRIGNADRIMVKPFLMAARALKKEKEKLHASIVSALSSCTSGWHSIHPDDVTISHIGGAMTNLVFIASKPRGENADVIVRIYGEGAEGVLISRPQEIRIFQLLSEKSIGIKLLAEFANGRVEKKIDGLALTASEMRDPSISAMIARQMHQFHRLQIDIEYQAQYKSELKRFMQIARIMYAEQSVEGIPAAEYFDQYERNAAVVEKYLETIPSPLVLSHNDLQYGNIMRRSDGTIVLIDFEYCSYNPRGYDIGNHFCEWAFDYHKLTKPHLGDFTKYPKLQEQQNFCRAYLTIDESVEISESQVDALCQESNAYSLISHLLWSLWGLIQAKQSDIDFDFTSYASCRYQAFKEQLHFISL